MKVKITEVEFGKETTYNSNSYEELTDIIRELVTFEINMTVYSRCELGQRIAQCELDDIILLTLVTAYEYMPDNTICLINENNLKYIYVAMSGTTKIEIDGNNQYITIEFL